MADAFINAYQRELDALRMLGDGFARAHPKIAGRLRLSRDTIDDPHVERLLEGVAFLTGRVQQRLDDDYPELTDALLDILYPHYLAPLPSACVVQFAGMADARAALEVPAGAPLQTSAPDGTLCRFRVTAPTAVWPLRMQDARVQLAPFDAPVHPGLRQAQAVLSLRLCLTDPQARLSDLAPERLEFFIHAAPDQAAALYELLGGHVTGLALAAGPNDDRPTILPPGSLRPCGFAEDDALYPWPEQSFSGFRLLTEYFALPEKFRFFEIDGLEARMLVEERSELTLFVYFDTIAPPAALMVHPDTFRLNCAPVVNLYNAGCEPIRLTHWRTEYPIDPPRNGPSQAEIWRIDAVSEIFSDGSSRAWQPLHRRASGEDAAVGAGEYTVTRRPSPLDTTIETSLVPLSFGAAAQEPEARHLPERLLSIDATLSDGDLPSRLPFGDKAPLFRPERGLGSVTQIACLTPPSQSWRRQQRERSAWALITHLSLNHLSLSGGPDAAQAVRDILTLHDIRQSEQTRSAIAGLLHVESRPTVARLADGLRIGLCRGLEITLTFEATAWREHGLFLLASVLERFFALHVACNNFVRTTVRLTGQPDPVARFLPRAGHRHIL